MSNTLADFPQAIIPFKANGYQITVTPQAIEAKTKIVALCKSISTVENDEAQGQIVSVVAAAKGLAGDAEKTRKEIKDPYLKACQAIDSEAKSFCDDLTAESKRLEKLLGSYQAEKMRKAMEEQRRVADEAAKAQKAIDDARHAAEQAERNRLAAQAAAEAAKGREKTKLEEAAKKAAEEAQRAASAAAEAEFDAMEAAEQQIAVVSKPVGATIKPDEQEIEVYDIAELLGYILEKDRAKLLDLFNVEPKKRALKDHIFFHCGGKDIPGLRVTNTTRVQVRAKSVNL